jgi:hypothetical protein
MRSTPLVLVGLLAWPGALPWFGRLHLRPLPRIPNFNWERRVVREHVPRPARR